MTSEGFVMIVNLINLCKKKCRDIVVHKSRSCMQVQVKTHTSTSTRNITCMTSMAAPSADAVYVTANLPAWHESNDAPHAVPSASSPVFEDEDVDEELDEELDDELEGEVEEELVEGELEEELDEQLEGELDEDVEEELEYELDEELVEGELEEELDGQLEEELDEDVEEELEDELDEELVEGELEEELDGQLDEELEGSDLDDELELDGAGASGLSSGCCSLISSEDSPELATYPRLWGRRSISSILADEDSSEAEPASLDFW
jgi:hypothetical protein